MAFVPAALPTLRRAHPRATCVRMGAGDGSDTPVSRAAFLRLAAAAGVSAAVSAAGGVPAASAFSIPNPFGGKGDAEKPAKTVGGEASALLLWLCTPRRCLYVVLALVLLVCFLSVVVRFNVLMPCWDERCFLLLLFSFVCVNVTDWCFGSVGCASHSRLMTTARPEGPQRDYHTGQDGQP